MFSVFLTSDGKLLSCGSNRYGCLGLGNDVPHSPEPAEVHALAGVHVRFVAAGRWHVIASCTENRLYAWGSCSKGALGLGKDRHYSWLPIMVESPLLVQLQSNRARVVQKIECNDKCTIILLEGGQVLACGLNVYDRLALGPEVDIAWELVSV